MDGWFWFGSEGLARICGLCSGWSGRRVAAGAKVGFPGDGFDFLCVAGGGAWFVRAWWLRSGGGVGGLEVGSEEPGQDGFAPSGEQSQRLGGSFV